MKRLILGSAVLLATTASFARAQPTKTVTGETKTVTATVEAIEQGSREVTVKKADGNYEVFYVPAGIKRFDTLKIGDKVSARYYENMVLRLKPQGEKDTDQTGASMVASKQGPAGTVAHQTTITATITAIDQSVPSITFTGPRNWRYSTRVEDKKALAKVKVGDKVDITWTEAMIVSLDDGK